MSQKNHDIKEESEDFTQFLHSINLNLDFKREDPPDFLMLRNDKIIGVEHTRIFQPSDSKGVNLQHQEAVKKKIVATAEQLLNRHAGHKAIISVNFRDVYGLRRDKDQFELFDRDIEELAKKIYKIVLNYINDVSPAITINRSNCRGLDRRISEILIDKFDYLKKCHFDHGPGGVIPQITKDILDKEIKTKNKKITDYLKKCDIIWLLLVIDSYKFERTFDNERLSGIKTWEFETEFDSVFLFMKRELQTFKLKTS